MSGKVCICIDLTKLNESIQSERHPLPAIEQTLAQLTGAKFFSKLDTNSGFWQIPLDPASSRLVMFISPFGRNCFDCLPFEISSAPEHFQQPMSEALAGLTGVVCMMDDILIHGTTQEEHDERLGKILQCFKELGMMLNSVKFLGHVVDSSGIKPDPSKVFAILDMRPPGNVGDIRRLLGTANQLSKFLPHLADIMQPIWKLFVKGNVWVWGDAQPRAFTRIKEEYQLFHSLIPTWRQSFRQMHPPSVLGLS